MLPWKLLRHQSLPVNQNLLSVYFSVAKFQLVSWNLSLAMIWQMTYPHKLPKQCSVTLMPTQFMLKAGGIYWPWKTLSSHLNHNICSLVYLFQLRPIVFDDWLIPSSYLHISLSFLKIKDRDHFEDSKVPSNVTSRKIPFILMSDKWDIYDYADLLRCFRGYVLCAVSLLTLVAIGIDRLLALLLGLRYRQVITSRRTCMTLIVWWIFSIVGISTYFWDPLVK